MTLHPNERPETPRRKLFRRGAATSPAAPEAAIGDQAMLTPLPVLEALELLALARGITTDRTALAAALPMAQDALAARLAPLAVDFR